MPPPEPQQLAIAKARIVEMEAGVVQAEQRAAAIEADIDLMVRELENQRDIASRLRQSIFAERALIAPLRRLPPEILGEIITYCAMDPAAPRTILATLSLVCRAWWETTLATPSAWCNIQVVCTTVKVFHARPPEDRLRDARMMFSRARSCPKDVTISGWVDVGALELANAVLDLVGEHAATLRSFHVAIACGSGPPLSGLKVKECLSLHMPILRGLFLHDFDPRASIAIDLAQMPRLIALGECDSNLRIPSTTSDIRLLHRITVVSSSRRDQKLVQLLSELQEDGSLQHLRTLSLRCLSWDDQPLHRDLIRAESLTSLVLNCWNGVCDFFDALVAPNLQRLIVNHSGGTFTKIQSSAFVKSLSARGYPPLRDLYLGGMPLSDSDLTNFLRKLNLLETLVIYRARSSDKVMEALASIDSKKGSSGDWICPRLSRFAIQSADSKSAKFTISRVAVTDFVDARMTALTMGVVSKPVAQLVGVHHNNGELKGFGLGVPRDEWVWQDDSPRSRSSGHDWWTIEGIDLWWIRNADL